MCLQCCLEDTHCCAGSDVVWKSFMVSAAKAFAADTMNDRGPHKCLDTHLFRSNCADAFTLVDGIDELGNEWSERRMFQDYDLQIVPTLSQCLFKTKVFETTDWLRCSVRLCCVYLKVVKTLETMCEQNIRNNMWTHGSHHFMFCVNWSREV